MDIETIELRKIIASEGMILTDGEHYGRVIFLSDDADTSKWSEITKEEYAEIQRIAAEELENEIM